MQITKEQFMEWKEHPVTKEVFNEIKELTNVLTKKLTSGQTIEYNAEATHGLTNRLVGQLEGFNQLLNISYDDTDEVTPEEDNLDEIG